MAKLGVMAAAKAAGVSRHTIWRYVKSGKLSATSGRDGERVIDTSELLRVFGELQRTEPVAAPSPSNGVQPAEPQVTVAMLQRRIEEQEAEIERLRAEAAGERNERRALQDRYLTIIERLQLTGPAPTPPKPAPRSRPKTETPPKPAASVLETVAGSVSSWLNGRR